MECEIEDHTRLNLEECNKGRMGKVELKIVGAV